MKRRALAIALTLWAIALALLLWRANSPTNPPPPPLATTTAPPSVSIPPAPASALNPAPTSAAAPMHCGYALDHPASSITDVSSAEIARSLFPSLDPITMTTPTSAEDAGDAVLDCQGHAHSTTWPPHPPNGAKPRGTIEIIDRQHLPEGRDALWLALSAPACADCTLTGVVMFARLVGSRIVLDGVEPWTKSDDASERFRAEKLAGPAYVARTRRDDAITERVIRWDDLDGARFVGSYEVGRVLPRAAPREGRPTMTSQVLFVNDEVHVLETWRWSELPGEDGVMHARTPSSMARNVVYRYAQEAHALKPLTEVLEPSPCGVVLASADASIVEIDDATFAHAILPSFDAHAMKAKVYGDANVPRVRDCVGDLESASYEDLGANAPPAGAVHVVSHDAFADGHVFVRVATGRPLTSWAGDVGFVAVAHVDHGALLIEGVSPWECRAGCAAHVRQEHLGDAVVYVEGDGYAGEHFERLWLARDGNLLNAGQYDLSERNVAAWGAAIPSLDAIAHFEGERVRVEERWDWTLCDFPDGAAPCDKHLARTRFFGLRQDTLMSIDDAGDGIPPTP